MGRWETVRVRCETGIAEIGACQRAGVQHVLARMKRCTGGRLKQSRMGKKDNPSSLEENIYGEET